MHDQFIVVENGRIADMFSYASKDIAADYNAHYLVPSFIDLQIYGAREKLFSMYPSAGTLQAIYDHCKESGTSKFVVTVATNTEEIMLKSIDAVREYWQQDGQGLIGLHLEGPWINPAKRGAHIESYIKTPEIERSASTTPARSISFL